MTDLEFMKEALDEARAGLAEGGIPIGSVLVIDGKVVNLDLPEAKALMARFIADQPDVWCEDIGEE